MFSTRLYPGWFASADQVGNPATLGRRHMLSPAWATQDTWLLKCRAGDWLPGAHSSHSLDSTHCSRCLLQVLGSGQMSPLQKVEAEAPASLQGDPPPQLPIVFLHEAGPDRNEHTLRTVDVGRRPGQPRFRGHPTSQAPGWCCECLAPEGRGLPHPPDPLDSAHSLRCLPLTQPRGAGS